MLVHFPKFLLHISHERLSVVEITYSGQIESLIQEFHKRNCITEEKKIY